jgi:hypothetical protein
MKRVIIFQENAPPAELHDPDEKDLEEYTKDLQTILESGNITQLTTPNSSLIVKPSKITSILVNEYDLPSEDEVMEKLQVQEEVKEKKKEEDIDIVTDIDE